MFAMNRYLLICALLLYFEALLLKIQMFHSDIQKFAQSFESCDFCENIGSCYECTVICVVNRS